MRTALWIPALLCQPLGGCCDQCPFRDQQVHTRAHHLCGSWATRLSGFSFLICKMGIFIALTVCYRVQTMETIINVILFVYICFQYTNRLPLHFCYKNNNNNNNKTLQIKGQTNAPKGKDTCPRSRGRKEWDHIPNQHLPLPRWLNPCLLGSSAHVGTDRPAQLPSFRSFIHSFIQPLGRAALLLWYRHSSSSLTF